MEILNESSGHLEAKIDFLGKSLDSNKAQIEDANRRLAGIDLQDVKEKRDFKRNILIGSLSSVGLLVLYVFSWLALPLAFGDNPVLSVPRLPASS
jgi:predicted ATPase with chaperone activity